ncbi:GntR family transcriptional regulator [Sphingomonas melonis]|uniref:DNA-binding Lrp family transcriptional regulator n=1 Tax=Sphingomonas melonis TaxID=152682 RepID=A0A7Y9FLQ9_9SPHN|nr:GntR family transcriptional regulator [Sphingomonas melonis]NYD89197.1 DNA-binding Lrp family transcriptional regulator [Sphingomonas melonis]
MSKPSAVTRVRSHLLVELRGAARRPGSLISVPDLAREMRMSHTPVREALERLAGEGLVAAQPSRRGFKVPRLGGGSLAGLYELEGILVEAAIRYRAGPPDDVPPACPADEGRDALERVEATLGIPFAGCANRSLVQNFVRTSNMLAPYRRFEPDVLPSWRMEIEGLRMAFTSRSGASKALRSFTRRRVAAASAICDAVERACPMPEDN